MKPIGNTLWRAWDRASIYLPVMLMGVMALGTYWLAQTTPVFSGPGARKAPTHVPDYFMRGFSVRSFDAQGRLKSEVHGAEARHYPDTDTLEIDQARLRSFGADGQLTVATANRALTSADGSEVQLFGEAVVTREPPARSAGEGTRLEIRSEFLHVFVQAERVRTHRPVVLRRGADEFHGDTLEYSHLDRILQMQGRVHGMMAARPAP